MEISKSQNKNIDFGLLVSLVADDKACTSLIVKAHFSKRGILKVCKAFLSRICHAVVFTQFGYADSKSAPCQALFLVLPFQN